MGIVVALGRRIGVGDGHQLQEAGAVRIGLDTAYLTAIPVAFENLAAPDEAEITQVAIAIVVVQTPIPGLDAATTGNPHRRMGLLHWAWPNIDIAQLRILAVKTERLRTGPGLDDEIVSFLILVAQGGRNFTIGKIRIHRGADRKAGNKTAAGHHVEHRKFFGNAHGRIVEGDAVAQHDDGGVFGASTQGCGHEVWGGHQAVRILMMFIDAEAVKAALVGKFQLVEEFVVEPVHFFGIVEFGGYIYPHAAVFFFEIFRQKAIRHKMEPINFHHAHSCGWSCHLAACLAPPVLAPAARLSMVLPLKGYGSPGAHDCQSFSPPSSPNAPGPWG